MNIQKVLQICETNRLVPGINTRIRRLSLGNPGDVKLVGEGASELRIDYGPGYRVYFLQQGREVVIFLST